jgi:hypothetical protein
LALCHLNVVFICILNPLSFQIMPETLWSKISEISEKYIQSQTLFDHCYWIQNVPHRLMCWMLGPYLVALFRDVVEVEPNWRKKVTWGVPLKVIPGPQYLLLSPSAYCSPWGGEISSALCSYSPDVLSKYMGLSNHGLKPWAKEKFSFFKYFFWVIFVTAMLKELTQLLSPALSHTIFNWILSEILVLNGCFSPLIDLLFLCGAQ